MTNTSSILKDCPVGSYPTGFKQPGQFTPQIKIKFLDSYNLRSGGHLGMRDEIKEILSNSLCRVKPADIIYELNNSTDKDSRVFDKECDRERINTYIELYGITNLLYLLREIVEEEELGKEIIEF